jgi:hypothetical protein
MLGETEFAAADNQHRRLGGVIGKRSFWALSAARPSTSHDRIGNFIRSLGGRGRIAAAACLRSQAFRNRSLHSDICW